MHLDGVNGRRHGHGAENDHLQIGKFVVVVALLLATSLDH